MGLSQADRDGDKGSGAGVRRHELPGMSNSAGVLRGVGPGRGRTMGKVGKLPVLGSVDTDSGDGTTGELSGGGVRNDWGDDDGGRARGDGGEREMEMDGRASRMGRSNSVTIVSGIL